MKVGTPSWLSTPQEPLPSTKPPLCHAAMHWAWSHRQVALRLQGVLYCTCQPQCNMLDTPIFPQCPCCLAACDIFFIASAYVFCQLITHQTVCNVQVGREDEFSVNRQQMVARIRVCMGGQVAEELIFGRDQVCTQAVVLLDLTREGCPFVLCQCL